MRIFGGEQIGGLMDRLKLPEDQPIENPLISRAIEQAQVKVEGFNFDIRKSLVEFDDVANQQREIVYKLRKRVLESKDVKEEVLDKLGNQIDRILLFAWPQDAAKPDPETVLVGLMDIVPFDDASKERLKKELVKGRNRQELKELLVKIILDVHGSREKQVGEPVMRQIEKYAYLGSIDHLWIDHIDKVDDLREGVRLRAYGQRDPLVEFKNEAYQMFEGLIDRIDEELSHRIFRIAVSAPRVEIPVEKAQTNIDTKDMTGLIEKKEKASSQETANLPQANKKKIGRNDPCWCGSGKKWKRCHYPQLPG
jgi:preprotein translocase subunit SecA